MTDYPDNMILPGKKKKSILDHKVPHFIIKEYCKNRQLIRIGLVLIATRLKLESERACSFFTGKCMEKTYMWLSIIQY